MAKANGSGSRLVLLASLVAALSVLWSEDLRAEAPRQLPDYVIAEFGERPAVPDGPLSEDLRAAVQVAFVDVVTQSSWGNEQAAALLVVAQSKDPRLAWIISDLLRFTASPQLNASLAATASDLLGKEFSTLNIWEVLTNHLIAWDIPAPPGYLEVKRAIYTGIVPGWDRIFVEGDIDWRLGQCQSKLA